MAALLWVALATSVVVGLAPLHTPAQAAETWTSARTADGRPDLQGVWAHNVATPLQRPPALAGKETLSDEDLEKIQKTAARLFASGSGDAAFGDVVFLTALAEVQDFVSPEGATGNYNQFWLVEREFDRRTSLVTDPPNGLVPPITREARERFYNIRALRQRLPQGPEDRLLSERCISAGVPRFEAGNNSYTQIFQTAEYVVILMEMIHDARIIPMDGRSHLPENVRQWHGDPRGRWEGDTLVVDTTNYSPKSGFVGSTEGLHLVERFTRVSQNTLHYEVTLDDPATWIRPWTAMMPLRRTDDVIFEYACHEGNYSMVGILAGARAEEKTAQEAWK